MKKQIFLSDYAAAADIHAELAALIPKANDLLQFWDTLKNKIKSLI